MFCKQQCGNAVCPIKEQIFPFCWNSCICYHSRWQSYSDSARCTFFPLHCLHQEIALFFSFGLTGTVPSMCAEHKIQRSQTSSSVPERDSHRILKRQNSNSPETTLPLNEEWGPRDVKQFTAAEPPVNGQATNSRDQRQDRLCSHPLVSKRRRRHGFLARPYSQPSRSGVLQTGQQPKSKEKPKSNCLKCRNVAEPASWYQLIPGWAQPKFDAEQFSVFFWKSYEHLLSATIWRNI